MCVSDKCPHHIVCDIQTIQHSQQKLKITYCCSLRTRRTWHPRLPRSTLHTREMFWKKVFKSSFIYFLSFHVAGTSLLWFQVLQVCRLFHQYLADPEKAGRRVSGLHLSFGTVNKHMATNKPSVFTHIYSFFANCTLRSLNASAALQKKSKTITATSVCVHNRVIFPIQVLEKKIFLTKKNKQTY